METPWKRRCSTYHQITDKTENGASVSDLPLELQELVALNNNEKGLDFSKIIHNTNVVHYSQDNGQDWGFLSEEQAAEMIQQHCANFYSSDQILHTGNASNSKNCINSLTQQGQGNLHPRFFYKYYNIPLPMSCVLEAAEFEEESIQQLALDKPRIFDKQHLISDQTQDEINLQLNKNSDDLKINPKKFNEGPYSPTISSKYINSNNSTTNDDSPAPATSSLDIVCKILDSPNENHISDPEADNNQENTDDEELEAAPVAGKIHQRGASRRKLLDKLPESQNNNIAPDDDENLEDSEIDEQIDLIRHIHTIQ